jgi:hypothetical protein
MSPWTMLGSGICIFVLLPLLAYIVSKCATLGMLKAKRDFHKKG